MSTAYVIASWSGKRECSDGNDYLQKHLDQLKKLETSLNQIVVVHPGNPNESPDYSEYINQLDGSEINGIPLNVIETTNDDLLSALRTNNISPFCRSPERRAA